jgi:hypothetical protein
MLTITYTDKPTVSMRISLIPGTILLASLLAIAVAQDEAVSFNEDAANEANNEVIEVSTELEAGGRAASRQVNCNCQCSSITFLDKYGQINGNCRSADSTGALWCYVDPRYSQCADLRRSTRFTSLWSYQACATPDLYSAQCGGYQPFNGNGFGSGFNTAGYPNLAPGPEGFPFNQNGGYPGLGSGGSGGYPTGGAGYPTGGAGYPTGGAGYPTGGVQNYPKGNSPTLVELLEVGKRKEETDDTIVFSN